MTIRKGPDCDSAMPLQRDTARRNYANVSLTGYQTLRAVGKSNATCHGDRRSDLMSSLSLPATAGPERMRLGVCGQFPLQILGMIRRTGSDET